MQGPVVIRVNVDEAWHAGTRLQLYTDRGTGTVDTNAPLLPVAVPVFGENVRAAYGVQPFGRGRFGTSKPRLPRGGVGTITWGKTPFGETPPPSLDLGVQVSAAFGAWKFQARAVDAAGNPQPGVLGETQRVVSGTRPTRPLAFAFDSYDAPTDRATFAFALNSD